MKDWKRLYECPCGKQYETDAGSFDSKFFLKPDLCYSCGRDKSAFTEIGIGYWKFSWKKFGWEFNLRNIKS
jgi:hypothetical protein